MLMVQFAQTTFQYCSYPALENVSVLGACFLSSQQVNVSMELFDYQIYHDESMGNPRQRKKEKGKETDQSIFKFKTPLTNQMVGTGRCNCTVGCAYMLWRKLHRCSKPTSLCNADIKSGEE